MGVKKQTFPGRNPSRGRSRRFGEIILTSHVANDPDQSLKSSGGVCVKISNVFIVQASIA
jgi:hypothetical protein